ncbi:hypothetical protein BH10PSE18_BH10PSE18_27270 [soil metagenome]
MRRNLRPLLVRAVGALLAATALAGVFALYTRPAFLVSMIDQMWSCF